MLWALRRNALFQDTLCSVGVCVCGSVREWLLSFRLANNKWGKSKQKMGHSCLNWQCYSVRVCVFVWPKDHHVCFFLIETSVCVCLPSFIVCFGHCACSCDSVYVSVCVCLQSALLLAACFCFFFMLLFLYSFLFQLFALDPSSSDFRLKIFNSHC